MKHLIAKRFAMVRELAALDATIEKAFIEQFAVHAVGDVIDHTYHGGGKFIIDKITCAPYYVLAGKYGPKHGPKSDLSRQSIDYSGRVIKANGQFGTRIVSHWQSIAEVIAEPEGGDL